ncbi:MAG: AAA family ATPase [Patescibacteria group bacterium]
MRKLILFAGLPGVGKSTISKKLSKKIGATLVNIDDFKKCDVDPVLVRSQIDPPELRWVYYQKALNYVFGLFERGTATVIMDEVFHLHSLRAQLEALCVQQGVDVLWVEVRCSYQVVKQRLQSKKREGHLLSTQEALNMYLLFRDIFEAFPARGQQCIIVDNETDSAMDVFGNGIFGERV